MRENSERYPGKYKRHMFDSGGPTVLESCYTRVELALDHLGEPTVITPDLEVAVFCEDKEIPFFKSWPTHRSVLEELCQYAEESGADAIIKVTGDCPLVDKEILARTEHYLRLGNEFVILTTYPFQGFNCAGVYTKRLKALRDRIRYHEEHGTTAFYEVEPLVPPFKKLTRVVTLSERRGSYPRNFSVDTPDDLAWVRAVVEKTGLLAGAEEIIRTCNDAFAAGWSPPDGPLS